MSAIEVKEASGRCKTEETEKISLSSLSELTGFPETFIKEELVLEGESISLKDLRESVLSFLDNTDKSLKAK